MRRACRREAAGRAGDRVLCVLAAALAALVTPVYAMSSPGDGLQAPPVEQDGAADEKTILALEDAWGRALQEKDRSALERIVAPDFTFIEPDGSVRDREGYLRDRSSDPVEIAAFEGSDVRVKVFGETALVTGVSTIDETRGGKRYRFSLRWKELWRRNPVGWQVVAGQATPVNPAWDAPFGVPVRP